MQAQLPSLSDERRNEAARVLSFPPSHHLSVQTVQNLSFTGWSYLKGRYGIGDGVLNIDATLREGPPIATSPRPRNSLFHFVLLPTLHDLSLFYPQNHPTISTSYISPVYIAIYVTGLAPDSVDSPCHAPAPLHSLCRTSPSLDDARRNPLRS
jgi:hypothetical protein